MELDNKKFWVFVIILVFIGALWTMLSDTPKTRMDCLKLGSNLRASLCIQELEKDLPTPTEKPTIKFPINFLQLTDQKMDGNTYYNLNPTYSATLTNRNKVLTATNIVFRFKLYEKYNKTQTCDDQASDTRYFTVTEVVIPGDSRLVKFVVATPLNTSQGFTWSWCADIVDAEAI